MLSIISIQIYDILKWDKYKKNVIFEIPQPEIKSDGGFAELKKRLVSYRLSKNKISKVNWKETG